MKISPGQNISYSTTGGPGTLYMMSQDDIDLISSGELFSFMPEASMVNLTGVVDVQVSPGTYWFIIDFYNWQEEEIAFAAYWQPIETSP